MVDRIRITAGAVAFVALAAAAGCVSRSPGARAAAESNSAERGSRYALLPAEFGKAKADNVYDVIAKLRPDFLRGRGDATSFIVQDVRGGSKDPGPEPLPRNAGTAVVSAPLPVIAYHDRARLSSVDDLKLISLTDVVEIRYVPGPEAGVKYGSNHGGGVILVTSK
jgi:hypothetical protein